MFVALALAVSRGIITAARGWVIDPHPNPQLMELKWIHEKAELVELENENHFHLGSSYGWCNSLEVVREAMVRLK